MNAETNALIKSYYEAFNAGNMKLFFSLLSENIIHDTNQGGREIGIAPFIVFMERMNKSYKEQLTDITIMSTPDGTRGAAEFVVHGEYLQTDEGFPGAKGQRYHLPAGAFFEVRGGKIARITNYYNLQDWIRQVSG